MQSVNRLIVGVDFGTTYTGFSYVISSQTSKKIITHQSWSGSDKGSFNALKTPSRIAYAKENRDLDDDQVGFHVTPGLTSCSWFKLFLQPDKQYETWLVSEGIGMMRLPSGKSAQEVCTDYLKGIYEEIVTTLRRNSGSVFAATPIDFLFTVPAIWSLNAKNDTLKAASGAGFGSRRGDSMVLIPEPEAAALAVLDQLASNDLAQIEPGDILMIVDCGGGTVDLTTYSISQVIPCLAFHEIAIGDGAKCGSTYIDQAFHEWMSKKFGPAFDGLPFGKKGPGSDFMKRFESVKMNFRKPAFNRSKKRMYELPLRMPKARDCENYDEEEAMVRIAWSTIEGFFQPVVTQVLDLVSEQVMQVSDTSILSANKMRLVMTGGFADSDYLFEALQDWNEAGGQSFDIFRAERGEAAIAVGAAIRGLSGSGSHPVSRKCRQHYALGLGLKFNRDLDDIKNTYIDQFDGRRMTPACLMWKIAKGDTIDPQTRITQEIQRVWEQGDPLRCTLELWSSNAKVPPRHQGDEPGLERVGEVSIDLTNQNLDIFEKKWDAQKARFLVKLEYEVQIFMGSRDDMLGVRSMCNGKVVGMTQIKYAHD